MSRKRNILLVANWESDVGYAWWLMENFWKNISDHFFCNGISSYLAYPKIKEIPSTIVSSNINIFELDFHNHSLRNTYKIYRAIKNNEIKYIYLTDWPSYDSFYILLRLWGVKNIIVHDHTPGERSTPSRLKSLIKSFIQRTPFVTADHFIAVSDFVYKRFIKISRIPPQKCSCAKNGIIPINICDIDKEYAYHVFDIPLNRSIIVTTGRSSYYKGIDFFIECAHELINNMSNNNLHFLYCGDGPDIESFKALVNEYKLNRYFTFAGNRVDVRKILPCCKIGFHAATGEVGYSLSILEYMSAGLVTIAPDRPSTSLAIKHMQNGLLYTYRDLKSATHMILLALDDQRCTHIRKNAVDTVMNDYNIKDTNKTLINILERILK